MTTAWVDAVADVTALLHSTRDGVLFTNAHTHALLHTHSAAHLQEIASKLYDPVEHRAWEAARAKKLEQEQIARKIEALEQEARDAANAFGDYLHRWTHFCEEPNATLPLPAADAAVVASGRYEHDEELMRKLEEWASNVAALDDDVDGLVALADEAMVSLTDYDAAAAALSTPLPPPPQRREPEDEREVQDD